MVTSLKADRRCSYEICVNGSADRIGLLIDSSYYYDCYHKRYCREVSFS